MCGGMNMEKRISFSSGEKKFSHILRNRISHSEDIVDLGNLFASTILEMIRSLAKPLISDLKADDITFVPGDKLHYRISERLIRRDDFRAIWDNSDLSSIIERFARCVHHHYLHLAGHPEKTVKKIRN